MTAKRLERAIEELDIAFKKAKSKFAARARVLGNTYTPWRDFPQEHLENRMLDEFVEWLKTKDPDELLDIINMAAFRYLSEEITKSVLEGRGGKL